MDQDCEKLENWTLQEIIDLQIDEILNENGFLFLWSGSEHLDDARNIFESWNLKRCEDIVWIKSNINDSRLKNESYFDKN